MNFYILNRHDIEKTLTMKNAIESMKYAFLQLEEKHAEMPLRTSIKLKDKKNICLFMPAYFSENEELGIKVVSSFPSNKKLNLPSIHGVILLINGKTGEPEALLDAGYLTALRTGATSAVATDLLAVDNASCLTIIGSGVQARWQLEGVCAVRKIKEVNLYSRSKEHAEKFAEEIRQIHPNLSVKVYETIPEACVDADVICTATNATEAFIHIEFLKSFCHINAIGSHTPDMREIGISVFWEAKIIVDQKEAALREAGEIIDAFEEGLLDKSKLIELGSLIKHPRKELKKSLTVFKSVGLAIQDISIAEKTLEVAKHKNIGTLIDL